MAGPIVLSCVYFPWSIFGLTNIVL